MRTFKMFTGRHRLLALALTVIAMVALVATATACGKKKTAMTTTVAGIKIVRPEC